MELVVRNLHTRETDLADSGTLEVAQDDIVVYQGRYGEDLGVALGPVSDGNRKQFRKTYRIDRVATDSDMTRYREHEQESHRAARICADRVEEHDLDMRIVSGHYSLDRSKLLFFFVSDHRVDFRGLVRDLVSRFHVRVELRQIGVRDETRIIGGLGICGRRLCCNGVSDRLAPVSIRMAKDQNYSLNSMKVSGPCGRLLCCLSYEHDYYREERRRYPKEGAAVDVEGDVFRVHEINILSGQVRMFGPQGQYTSVPVCAFARETADGAKNRGSGPDWCVNFQNCPAGRIAVGTE
ncbi:MAG TPA: regulatory iron-sulfur-containing complex subunit RicT [Alkalispirochaeta sp.]|nr:regulatory iron-sulfur-containing complex subunit RicT [Alkalispirochaeta sp.]